MLVLLVVSCLAPSYLAALSREPCAEGSDEGCRIAPGNAGAYYDPPVLIGEAEVDSIDLSGLALRITLEQQDTKLQVRLETLRRVVAPLTFLQPKSFAVRIVTTKGNEIPVPRSCTDEILSEVGHGGVLTGKIDYYIENCRPSPIVDVAIVRVRFGMRDSEIAVYGDRRAPGSYKSNWIQVASGKDCDGTTYFGGIKTRRHRHCIR